MQEVKKRPQIRPPPRSSREVQKQFRRPAEEEAM